MFQLPFGKALCLENMCSFPIQIDTTFLAKLLSPATTLLAAFLGAWFAFLLQNKREKKKERDANVSALNGVQINLTQQLNILAVFNNSIQRYKNHSMSWLSMPAFPPRNYSKFQIDGGSLSFLAERNHSELILEILVVEEKFQEVITLINLRSEIHILRLQPKLGELGFVEGGAFDKSPLELEKELGAPLVTELKRITNGLIDLTED